MKTRIRHIAEDVAAVALAASWIFALIVLFTLEACTHPIEKMTAFVWLFVACPAVAWQLCSYAATHE